LKSIKITAKKLVLDQCSRCSGIWFEKNELAILLDKQPSGSSVFPELSVKLDRSKCPKCDDSLYQFRYPETITLANGCKQCEGIWLNSKEWIALSHTMGEKNINTTSRATGLKNQSVNEQSYADNIPGLKGALLRMIDSTIKNLSTNLF